MNSGKIGCDYLNNKLRKLIKNQRRRLKNMDTLRGNLSVKELENKIKDLEHRERYSKNQMEKRNLRSQIGQLQRDLVIAKKREKN